MIPDAKTAAEPILRLTDGIWFTGGPQAWALPPLRLGAGDWATLAPAGSDAVVDPSGPLAHTLATLAPPSRGTVELLGRDVYKIPYPDLQRLRARLGYVQGYGGLLSNRTLRENIALPVSVHGKRSFAEEEACIDRMIDSYALASVVHLRPSDVDGATRWQKFRFITWPAMARLRRARPRARAGARGARRDRRLGDGSRPRHDLVPPARVQGEADERRRDLPGSPKPRI